MTAQIVFLTLFLGLTSGTHEIEVRADPGVQSMRITLDGREVALIKHPPWKADVDFGAELIPRELTASGYSGTTEIARATQVINLPRSAAELTIVMTYDGKAQPTGAELHWQHVMGVAVKNKSLELDGTALPLDEKGRAAFNRIDITRPHIVAAEVEFIDGTAARRETVFGGMLPEMMPAELTATVVHRTKSREKPAEKCFAARGEVLRTAAVEKPRGIVVIVREPSSQEALLKLDRPARARPGNTTYALQHAMALDHDTDLQMLWPVAQRFVNGTSPGMLLFDNSSPISSRQVGTFWAVTRAVNGGDLTRPRRYADAVAVAGITATEGSRRRAVILIVGADDEPDKSDYAPAVVRRYLESVGVPLFVWSLSSKRDASAWGNVDDISTYDGLRVASDKVRAELDRQRIAWIDTDAVTALRVEAREDCGYEPVAK